MVNLLPFAIIFITSALVFYSIGVWGEKIVGRLKAWQLIFFWLGFVCDTTGTTLMTKIAGNFQFNIHGITGLAAIILMIIHAVWATITLVKKNENAIKNFHRFSLVVWFIWLIPFLSGMILAMAH
jgi:uncharacterized repeat protein (TIGR03987 family)